MLSILIPTYNYPVFLLVERLHYLCIIENINFEILCYDDGSINAEITKKNAEINSFENCKYIIGTENKGLSFARNYLMDNAKFSNILFLDADMMPETDLYIKNYLPFLKTNYAIIFGGIYYEKNIDKNMQLRYKYGVERETKTAEERNKNPYKLVFYNNTLMNLLSFNGIKFNENIASYGYEDLEFTKNIFNNKLPIYHINNPILHDNKDTSIGYITKVNIATTNLFLLFKNNILEVNDSSIIKSYEGLKKYKLLNLFIHIFTKFENHIYKNLLSEKPYLFYFDLYKLGFFIKKTRD